MGCTVSLPQTLFTNKPTTTNSFEEAPAPASASSPDPLPLNEGDTHHLVSLTSSTTYNSLLPDQPPSSDHHHHHHHHNETLTLKSETLEISSPNSVINGWELMDRLDDDLDFSSKPKPNSNSGSLLDRSYTVRHDRSSSKKSFFARSGYAKKLVSFFETTTKTTTITTENSISKSGNSVGSSAAAAADEGKPKPPWKQESLLLLADMDPNVGSGYRRAMSSRQLGFTQSNNRIRLPGTENKIVIYFTSLRGIRRTYEDCSAVRNIFGGFRVTVDERDTSMDSSYRRELQSVLEEKIVSLPQIFIRGRYIGGAEEIKQLHEIGELAKLLEGLPIRDPRFVCKSCGNARFVPCLDCSGSRKIFDEEDEGQLRRCLVCNENGLIRCPTCTTTS